MRVVKSYHVVLPRMTRQRFVAARLREQLGFKVVFTSVEKRKPTAGKDIFAESSGCNVMFAKQSVHVLCEEFV